MLLLITIFSTLCEHTSNPLTSTDCLRCHKVSWLTSHRECFPKCHIDKLILKMSFSFSFFCFFAAFDANLDWHVLWLKNTHSKKKPEIQKPISWKHSWFHKRSVFISCQCFHRVSLTAMHWLKQKTISYSGA